MRNLVQIAFTEKSVITTATLEELCDSTHLYVIFINARSGSSWLTELAELGGPAGYAP